MSMKSLLLGVAFVVLAGCSAAPQVVKGSRGPEPAFDSLALDIGRMDSEDERDVAFAVRNTGGSALRVERVDTTCGCAKPQFPRVLEPGDAGKIVVRFTPEAHAAGEKIEGVKVYTNARAEPYLLRFRADLQPLLRLAPGTPLIVPIVPGGRAAQIVALTPRPGSGVRVLSFESADRRVMVQRVPTTDGSFVARLVIRSNGPGDFQARLIIHATHPRLGALAYLLNVQAVRGPFGDPPALRVAALAGGAVGTVLPAVVVRARDRAVAVSSATLTDRALEVAGIEPGEGATSIRVRYRGGWKGGGVRKVELVVNTDHPEFPVLRVPIEINVF